MTGTFDEYGNYDPGPLLPDEQLLIDQGDSEEKAFLGFDMNRNRYILSFREAADTLVTSMMNQGSNDLLVLPILFSYRHWLELQLKDLAILGMQLRGETPEEIIGHDLRDLWSQARQAIEETFSEGSLELDAVERIVHQLADLDPNSISFRYATDRIGRPTLPTGISRVNVGHIGHVMLQVAMVLEGAADGMDHSFDSLFDR